MYNFIYQQVLISTLFVKDFVYGIYRRPQILTLLALYPLLEQVKVYHVFLQLFPRFFHPFVVVGKILPLRPYLEHSVYQVTAKDLELELGSFCALRNPFVNLLINLTNRISVALLEKGKILYFSVKAFQKTVNFVQLRFLRFHNFHQSL